MKNFAPPWLATDRATPSSVAALSASSSRRDHLRPLGSPLAGGVPLWTKSPCGAAQLPSSCASLSASSSRRRDSDRADGVMAAPCCAWTGRDPDKHQFKDKTSCTLKEQPAAPFAKPFACHRADACLGSRRRIRAASTRGAGMTRWCELRGNDGIAHKTYPRTLPHTA